MLVLREGIMQTAAHSIPFTRHATIRMQQRSIPLMVIDLLVDFGDSAAAGAGACSYFFSKRSWQRVCRHAGAAAKHFERRRNVYIIMSDDGVIVTAAWRH